MALTWVAVLAQRGGQHQTKLVAQLHRVQPRVDVQNQVHLERLGLAVQPADAVELLALRVHVLHVEDVLEQNTGHGVNAEPPDRGASDINVNYTTQNCLCIQNTHDARVIWRLCDFCVRRRARAPNEMKCFAWRCFALDIRNTQSAQCVVLEAVCQL